MGFFSVFLDTNLLDSKNLKVSPMVFSRPKKNMGLFFLALKIQAGLWGCASKVIKKKHPGSPKTKLCPLVVGNPLHGSSQRLFFVWSWTSREQPTKTPTEKSILCGGLNCGSIWHQKMGQIQVETEDVTVITSQISVHRWRVWCVFFWGWKDEDVFWSFEMGKMGEKWRSWHANSL